VVAPASPPVSRSRWPTPSAKPARSRPVETFGTATIDPDKLPGLIQDYFDLRPAAIIRPLDLRRPIYRKTAPYGHFGRPDKEFTWEQVDDIAGDSAPPSGLTLPYASGVISTATRCVGSPVDVLAVERLFDTRSRGLGRRGRVGNHVR